MSLEVAAPTQGLRIVDKGDLVVLKPASATSGSSSYTHGLGFAPTAEVFVWNEDAQTAIKLPIVSQEFLTGIVGLTYYFKVDNSNITVYVATPTDSSLFAAALQLPFKFYLYAERANA